MPSYMGIERARALALEWHQKPHTLVGTDTNKEGVQVDKNDRPYIEHLTGVEIGLRTFGADPELRACAYLHDIIEDTMMTAKELETLGVSERQMIAIKAVTKGSGEAQITFLDRIIAAGTDAEMLKLADLFHNTRPDRLAALPEGTRNRLRKKYSPSILRLLHELGYIVTTEEYQAIPASAVVTTYQSYGNETYTFSMKKASWFGSHDEIQLGKGKNKRTLQVHKSIKSAGKVRIEFTSNEFVEVDPDVEFMGRMTRYNGGTWQGDDEWSGYGTGYPPTTPKGTSLKAPGEVPTTTEVPATPPNRFSEAGNGSNLKGVVANGVPATVSTSKALEACKSVDAKTPQHGVVQLNTKPKEPMTHTPGTAWAPPAGSLDKKYTDKQAALTEAAMAVHSTD